MFSLQVDQMLLSRAFYQLVVNKSFVFGHGKMELGHVQ